MGEKTITAFVGCTAEGDHIYVDMSIECKDEETNLSASGFRIGKGRRNARPGGADA